METRDTKPRLFYNDQVITDFLPSKEMAVRVLIPMGYADVIKQDNLKQEFVQALNEPSGYSIDCATLIRTKVINQNKYLTILIDDNTRANVHTKILLPLLLDYLSSVGDVNYKIIIASGTHRKPSDNEIKEKILGEDLYNRVKTRLFIHDCDKDNQFLGETSRGTPIYIDRLVLDSGMVITITDSEYHYFAGQAGTVKSICPGVAGRETIRKNHPMMFDLDRGFKKEVRLGNTDGNPVIEDMKEIVKIVSQETFIFGIDAIVSDYKIVYLKAGDLIMLHELAKKPLRKLSVVEVPRLGDIVIVSAGSLGINLYQSGKAFHAGWNAVRKDGKGLLIVLAPCKDGIGNDAYYKAMESVKNLDPDEAMKFCIKNYCSPKTFKIGNQKPVDLFRIIKEVGSENIHIITEFDPKLLRDVFKLNAHHVGKLSVGDHIKNLITKQLQKISKPVIYIINDPSILVQLSG